MKEIATRLHENRQIQLAKEILESNGYEVTQKLDEAKSYLEEKGINLMQYHKKSDTADHSNLGNLYNITYSHPYGYKPNAPRNSDQTKSIVSVWGLDNAKSLKKEMESKGIEIVHVFNGGGKKVTI